MGAQILVVDDEDYICRLIRFVLEDAGYEVLLAGSTDEGLKLLREAHPDIVTIDLMMPGRSGLDMLAEMQADPAIRDVPSLVVTAVGIQADLEQANKLGATATLNKPFSHQQLIDAIRGVLGE
ncbi:MAG: response regulator [Anaerolineales bacterium]|nr:MAG: response regulator [Anaerolineales bacterium]